MSTTNDVGILNDPLLNSVYNDGLKRAAELIETYQHMPDIDPAVKAIIPSMVQAIRACEKPTQFSQTFAEAIRNDPYMDAKNKTFWLEQAQEAGQSEG